MLCRYLLCGCSFQQLTDVGTGSLLAPGLHLLSGRAETETPVNLIPQSGSDHGASGAEEIYHLLTEDSESGQAFFRACEGFQLKVSELGSYPGESKAWYSPLILLKSLSHLRERNLGLSPGRIEVFYSLIPSPKRFYCDPDTARCLDAEWNRLFSCLTQGTEEEPGLKREISKTPRKGTYPTGGCGGQGQRLLGPPVEWMPKCRRNRGGQSRKPFGKVLPIRWEV